MKKVLIILGLAAALAGTARAQTSTVQGYCQTGGVKVQTQGVNSTTMVQGSYPNCTVTVYQTGTGTLATLFSSAGGAALSNPFVAPTNGQWRFWASTSACYDVILTGGVPLALPSPQTYTDVCGGGGGGGGGSGTVTNVSTSGYPTPFGSVAITNPTTTPLITFTAPTYSQNFVLAGPTSGSGNPTARLLVPGDLPQATSSTFGTVKPDNSTITISGGVISAAGGGGAVSSVSNSDSSLTVTPTTGAVVASLNLAHANTWTAPQTFAGAGPAIAIPANVTPTPAATKAVVGTDASGNAMLSNNGDTAAKITRTNSGAAGNCVEFAANGVDLANAGVTCTGGFTAKIKYVSQLGCAAQNTDLNLGGGTDDTACINTALAGATASNPILLWQDGKSLISGAGIVGPAGGNWGITGNGGGLTQIVITACSITGGNLATFTTTANALVAGEGVTVKNLSNCAALNGQTLTVLSSGLTSTQFKATVSASNVSSASETATGVSLFGTGFFQAASAEDAISNGHPFAGGNCDIPQGPVPSRGANILMSNFVLNGNSPNQSTYCFGIDLHDINNITISGLTLYNIHKYATKFANVGDVAVTNSVCQAANNAAGGPSNTDCIHLEGPWNDVKIANDTFRVSDDPIALNSDEGYCGPGVRTEITNSTTENSLDAIRAYNQGAVCSNGLTPTIDTVDISNYSGTVYQNIAFFGLGSGTVGALNPALTNFHWDNSTIYFTGPTTGQNILMNENLGMISFSNDTFGGITTGTSFISSSTSGSSTTIAQLSLDNVKFVRTPVGQGPNALLGGNNVTIGSLVATGLGVYDAPGSSFANMACLFCLSGSNLVIDNLFYANIDTSKVTEITDPAQWGVSILASGNNGITPPSGVYKIHGVKGDINTYAPGTSGAQSLYWEFDPTPSASTFGQQTFVGNVATGQALFSQNMVYDGTNWVYTMPVGGGSRGAAALHMLGTPGHSYTWLDTPVSGTGGTTVAGVGTTDVAYLSDNPSGTPFTVFNPGGFSPTVHTNQVLGANATSNWWVDNVGGVHSTSAAIDSTAVVPLTLNSNASSTNFGISNTAHASNSFFWSTSDSAVLADEMYYYDGSASAGTNGYLYTVGGGISTPHMAMFSNGTYCWRSSTGGSAPSGSPDTCISRDSAGAVDVGNGTAGNKSGTMNLATLNVINSHVNFTAATAPVVSSCGGGTIAAGSTDNSFAVTGIAATTASCLVTFHAAVQQGFCVANAWDADSVVELVAPIGESTTSVAFTITSPSPTFTQTITAHCF